MPPLPPSPRDAALSATDYVLYGASVFIFGSGWLPLKMQLGVVAPEVSAVWRFLIASTVIFTLVFIRGDRLLFHWRDHVLFAAIGLCLFSLNFLSFYYAGYYLPSGLMSVVFALTAILVPVISAVVLGTPLRSNILIGAAAGIVGIALVFGPSILEAEADASGASEARMGLGLLLTFLGTCCFSVGSIISGVAGRRGLPLMSMTAFAIGYGFIILVLSALLRGAPFTVDWSVRYFASLAYLVAGPTLSGFGIYFLLVRRIGASRAGYGTVLYPLVALALSTVFEDFHWTLSAALGIALVLAGIVLVLRPSRAAPVMASEKG